MSAYTFFNDRTPYCFEFAVVEIFTVVSVDPDGFSSSEKDENI